MAVGGVGVLLVHLLFQPYEDRHVNIIESLVLINLVSVTVMFLNPTINKVPIWFSICLLLLPYLYGTLYLAWRLIRKIW